MAGKFEIDQASNGEFIFRLKAGNGEVILSSERYASKDGCKNGIASVQANAPYDHNYKRLEARDGSRYFNLHAANNQIIGTSQMYRSSGGMENGIGSVKDNAPTATTNDLT
jgi:uncharacterized protein